MFGGFFILFLPDLFLYMHVHIFNCAECTVQCVCIHAANFLRILYCSLVQGYVRSYPAIHIAHISDDITMAEMKKIPILNPFCIRLVRL